MKRSLLMFINDVVVTVSALAEESVCKDNETPKDCFAPASGSSSRKYTTSSAHIGHVREFGQAANTNCHPLERSESWRYKACPNLATGPI
jgi:hypothetical protein